MPSPSGPPDAARIVDALSASAEQEFQIAERLASKARQAFALAAGLYAVTQAVAFGSFAEDRVSSGEMLVLVIFAAAVVPVLGIAAYATLQADNVVSSGDLPLADLEDDLNAAYEGDDEVLGRLGSHYLGVVRSRRTANEKRRAAYKTARVMAVITIAATALELILALAVRV